MEARYDKVRLIQDLSKYDGNYRVRFGSLWQVNDYSNMIGIRYTMVGLNIQLYPKNLNYKVKNFHEKLEDMKLR